MPASHQTNGKLSFSFQPIGIESNLCNKPRQFGQRGLGTSSPLTRLAWRDVTICIVVTIVLHSRLRFCCWRSNSWGGAEDPHLAASGESI